MNTLNREIFAFIISMIIHPLNAMDRQNQQLNRYATFEQKTYGRPSPPTLSMHDSDEQGEDQCDCNRCCNDCDECCNIVCKAFCKVGCVLLVENFIRYITNDEEK